MTINHVIIEGCDRLGKDTLIEGIQNSLGFFQVIHYQKPKLLDHFVEAAQYKLWNQASSGSPFLERNAPEVKVEALKQYQFNSFLTMFKLMQNNTRIICNRAHLGETVYAKRYRGYDGNYVFDIERVFYDGNTLNKVLLVLLYTSDFSFITDDGLSLDVTKREVEQNDFIEAYSKTAIPNKIMIDVNNGSGGFISKDMVLGAVLNRMKSDF